MSVTRARGTLHQTKTGAPLKNANKGLGWFAFIEVHARAVGAVRVNSQRKVQVLRIPRRNGGGKTAVVLLERALAEGLVQFSVRLGIAREQHHSAGFAVQSMHNPELSNNWGKRLGEVRKFRVVAIRD